MSVFIFDKDRLNFTSNLLDQNNLIPHSWCKNQLIYIRNFEAIRKTLSRVLSSLKTVSFTSSF